MPVPPKTVSVRNKETGLVYTINKINFDSSIFELVDDTSTSESIKEEPSTEEITNNEQNWE